MMNFDEMMEAWKSQDDKPLYGVNRDLLQLVLRHEQADIQRDMRWDVWTTYAVGSILAVTGISLWAYLYRSAPALHVIAAATAALAVLALWIGALWTSRRRQAARERGFGNTVQEEVRRNLSLIDYQLSQVGRWGNLMLWSAPILVGTSLIYWFIMKINDNTNLWFDIGVIAFVAISIASTTYETSRRTRQQLLPRKERLSGLLDTLDRP